MVTNVSDNKIPSHLRGYVVEQDYAAYTARDHAVWRFVVGHAHARLREIAHPAYASGFAAAGIRTDAIPDLPAMSARLSEVGFRVACVDGFIPPRAFQAFQARGILPVAADIRTAAHLTYTPAPDIIHEAAGHAPFLAQPDYARFLRRIGAVSEQAFESSHDRAMYRAIYLLSELKESPGSTATQIAALEHELGALRASCVGTSEAARMARLYWWTVEYGLVGSLADYRLYGAGLLSSLGEAHTCFDPRVRKLPLSAECVDVDYDITRAQPQLFVATDFAQLESVLSEVAQTLSHARGGEAALRSARESEDRATLVLDTEFCVIGTVVAFDEAHVQLQGPCGVADSVDKTPAFSERCGDYVVLRGALLDGTSLSAVSSAAMRAYVQCDRVCFQTEAGLTVTGTLLRTHERNGLLRVMQLSHVRITRGATLLLEAHGSYPLLLAAEVRTATPLVPDWFCAATDYPARSVPKRRDIHADERVLIALHERVDFLRAHDPLDAAAQLADMHRVLRSDYPEEWLLRFNILDTKYLQRHPRSPLHADIARELAVLEQHFQRREPIATGLRALRALQVPDATSK